MKKAAAYMRYSTDKQTENSIAYQLQRITEYCAKNDMQIVDIYADEAQSGTNVDREGFQRLMRDAKSSTTKFEAVVIYEMSRGSRDIADWFSFRRAMLQARIEVISTSEKLGSMLDPNAFFMEAIIAAKGQCDVLQTRERSIAGVAVKAKQGKFLGGYAPIGYDVNNGEYIINESEAAIVRKIYEMYAGGASYDTIIDAVHGVHGKRGQPLGKNSIYEILQNERYIGVYTWNKRRVKLLRKWAGGTPNPNAVRIDGSITPIIDMDTWGKVRERMESNRKIIGQGSTHRSYLLTGLIKCGKCGAAYCGHTTKNKKGIEYTSYICSRKTRTRTCDAPNLPASELETFVVQNVKQWILQADFSAVAAEIAQRVNNTAPDLAREKSERAELQAKINNGVRAVLSGVTFPELNAEMDRLRERVAELDDIIARAESTRPKVDEQKIIKLLQEAAENWAPENIPTILHDFVQKIYTNPDGSVTVEIGVNLVGCGSRI